MGKKRSKANALDDDKNDKRLVISDGNLEQSREFTELLQRIRTSRCIADITEIPAFVDNPTAHFIDYAEGMCACLDEVTRRAHYVSQSLDFIAQHFSELVEKELSAFGKRQTYFSHPCCKGLESLLVNYFDSVVAHFEMINFLDHGFIGGGSKPAWLQWDQDALGDITCDTFPESKTVVRDGKEVGLSPFSYRSLDEESQLIDAVYSKLDQELEAIVKGREVAKDVRDRVKDARRQMQTYYENDMELLKFRASGISEIIKDLTSRCKGCYENMLKLVQKTMKRDKHEISTAIWLNVLEHVPSITHITMVKKGRKAIDREVVFQVQGTFVPGFMDKRPPPKGPVRVSNVWKVDYWMDNLSWNWNSEMYSINIPTTYRQFISSLRPINFSANSGVDDDGTAVHADVQTPPTRTARRITLSPEESEASKGGTPVAKKPKREDDVVQIVDGGTMSNDGNDNTPDPSAVEETTSAITADKGSSVGFGTDSNNNTPDPSVMEGTTPATTAEICSNVGFNTPAPSGSTTAVEKANAILMSNLTTSTLPPKNDKKKGNLKLKSKGSRLSTATAAAVEEEASTDDEMEVDDDNNGAATSRTNKKRGRSNAQNPNTSDDDNDAVDETRVLEFTPATETTSTAKKPRHRSPSPPKVENGEDDEEGINATTKIEYVEVSNGESSRQQMVISDALNDQAKAEYDALSSEIKAELDVEVAKLQKVVGDEIINMVAARENVKNATREFKKRFIELVGNNKHLLTCKGSKVTVVSMLYRLFTNICDQLIKQINNQRIQAKSNGRADISSARSKLDDIRSMSSRRRLKRDTDIELTCIEINEIVKNVRECCLSLGDVMLDTFNEDLIVNGAKAIDLPVDNVSNYIIGLRNDETRLSNFLGNLSVGATLTVDMNELVDLSYALGKTEYLNAFQTRNMVFSLMHYEDGAEPKKVFNESVVKVACKFLGIEYIPPPNKQRKATSATIENKADTSLKPTAMSKPTTNTSSGSPESSAKKSSSKSPAKICDSSPRDEKTQTPSPTAAESHDKRSPASSKERVDSNQGEKKEPIMQAPAASGVSASSHDSTIAHSDVAATLVTTSSPLVPVVESNITAIISQLAPPKDHRVWLPDKKAFMSEEINGDEDKQQTNRDQQQKSSASSVPCVELYRILQSKYNGPPLPPIGGRNGLTSDDTTQRQMVTLKLSLPASQNLRVDAMKELAMLMHALNPRAADFDQCLLSGVLRFLSHYGLFELIVPFNPATDIQHIPGNGYCFYSACYWISLFSQQEDWEPIPGNFPWGDKGFVKELKLDMKYWKERLEACKERGLTKNYPLTSILPHLLEKMKHALDFFEKYNEKADGEAPPSPPPFFAKMDGSGKNKRWGALHETGILFTERDAAYEGRKIRPYTVFERLPGLVDFARLYNYYPRTMFKRQSYGIETLTSPYFSMSELNILYEHCANDRFAVYFDQVMEHFSGLKLPAPFSELKGHIDQAVLRIAKQLCALLKITKFEGDVRRMIAMEDNRATGTTIDLSGDDNDDGKPLSSKSKKVKGEQKQFEKLRSAIESITRAATSLPEVEQLKGSWQAFLDTLEPEDKE